MVSIEIKTAKDGENIFTQEKGEGFYIIFNFSSLAKVKSFGIRLRISCHLVIFIPE